MPFGVTFWYHSQKSTSTRFSVLSGSCLTAGGHTASFINQVCIMLVNSFAIPGGITNAAGREAQAHAARPAPFVIPSGIMKELTSIMQT